MTDPRAGAKAAGRGDEPLAPAVEAQRVLWDRLHAVGPTPVLDQIRRRTVCANLPAGVRATTVWPAWPSAVLVAELAVRPGSVFADLGCGTGALGQWIAAQTGATAVGIDPSSAALDVARSTARGGRYQVGHFTSTGLEDASVDGVMVSDALQFCDDVPAAVAEMRRITRHGGRVVIVGPAHRQFGRPGPHLARGGFRVSLDEETPRWRDTMQQLLDELLAQREALREELGEGVVTIVENVKSAASAEWHGLVSAERRS